MLRPRSRLESTNAGKDDVEPGSLCGEGVGHDGTHPKCVLDWTHSQSPVEAGHTLEHRRMQPGNGTDRGGPIPCKPGAARMRSRKQRNRRLNAGDGGKTVVVLASVPRVTTEARSAKTPQETALLGSPCKEAVKVLPDQAVLPWPLGRRCW